jgi:hypothetical protein
MAACAFDPVALSEWKDISTLRDFAALLRPSVISVSSLAASPLPGKLPLTNQVIAI